jgi:signal transduction histidine kinase
MANGPDGAGVLYIDDDAGNRTVVEEVCGDEIPLVTAPSGPAGLELLAQREVGVLLVDQRMPGMTGVDVLEVARRTAPDTFRILITGYSDLNEAIAAINRGAVERYVWKPWQPDELIATLRDALAVYATRRKIQMLERRLVEIERVYALGVVAASVAHELRSPLTALSLTLPQLQENERRLFHTVSNNPSQALLARMIEKNSEHVATACLATNQMQEIVRGIELGQRHRRDRSADLREVATLTQRMLRSELMNRAHVSIEAEEGLPPVAGAPSQHAQVMLNLVVNAVQAFADSAGDRNHVHIRIRRAGDGVLLQVEDNGPGIDPSILPRIFDPFFTTKESGGTGLGLAISKKIIEDLGGTLTVKSVVGEGTSFSIQLRASTAAAEPHP